MKEENIYSLKTQIKFSEQTNLQILLVFPELECRIFYLLADGEQVYCSIKRSRIFSSFTVYGLMDTAFSETKDN